MLSFLQLHTKSLCVLALQNLQFKATTSSRPQTVYFEALGHKAILVPNRHPALWKYNGAYLFAGTEISALIRGISSLVEENVHRFVTSGFVSY